jgi:hypothetical protein
VIAKRITSKLRRIRYFMADELTPKDKADFQRFIDFSVQTGTPNT